MSNITLRENIERRAREIGNELCRKAHPDYHDSLICVGPGSGQGFSPPCDEHLKEGLRRARAEARQRSRDQ